jgi:hypothetical protein
LTSTHLQSNGVSGSLAASGEPCISDADPENETRLHTPRFKGLASVRILALCAFFLTLVVVFIYRPLSQREASDPAIYDYTAQSILRGQLPYRDVVDGKAPGASYLSALAMSTGRLIGLRDVVSVRLLHVLLAGLLSMITYLVAEAYLRNRVAAFLSSLVPLTSTQFVLMLTEGTEPKLAMILFGMLSLLMIEKQKPFLAGFCSMLSCLCWQPGLLFAGVSVLAFSQYLTVWRDLRAIKVLVGTSIPLLVVLLYFYSRGALGDFWSWTVTFNYKVYAVEGARPPLRALTHMMEIVSSTLRRDLVVIAMSVLGFMVAGIARFGMLFKSVKAPKSFWSLGDAILIPPLVYLAFCFVNFQGGPDLIPFFPFFGVFTGRLMAQASANKRTQSLPILRWAPMIALLLALALSSYRATTYKLEPLLSLQEQDKELKVISDLLGPDDKIYVHGKVEILVLLNKPNLNKYILFDHGKDEYASANTSGGFKAIVDEIESQAPKIVSVSRLVAVSHRTELKEWVAEHYELIPLDRYGIYIRRQDKLQTGSRAGPSGTL